MVKIYLLKWGIQIVLSFIAEKIKITLRLMCAKAYTTISTFKMVLNYVHYIVKR